jgi:hypothetical protein
MISPSYPERTLPPSGRRRFISSFLSRCFDPAFALVGPPFPSRLPLSGPGFRLVFAPLGPRFVSFDLTVSTLRLPSSGRCFISLFALVGP